MGCVHYTASLIKDNGSYARIDFTFTNGTKSYLSYNNFAVGPANSQYQLSISGFTGITDDPFGTYNINGMKFTTKDRDNDGYSGGNCATEFAGIAGGWWYKHCSHIYLNHEYKNRLTLNLHGKLHPLPFIEMKIKPYNC